MSIVFAILLFSFLIFIHELGHFSAAKLFGVQVNEFSVFMGPAIFKKQVGETLYSIRCIPLGGYCAMEGEDGDSENPRSLGNAAWWKRLIILVAGAFMNFVTGVLLLAIVFGSWDHFVMPVVDTIEEGSALHGAYGLQEGDRLLEMDGEKIYLYSDFSMLLTFHPGDVHDLVIERDGKKIVLNDFNMEKREFPNEDGTTSMRYGFNFRVEKATFGNRLEYVWNSSMNYVRLVRLSLTMLMSGQAGFQDLGGPVMIVDQISQAAKAAPSAYDALMNMLNFGAFLAINLAVMNLLPIPALDGGRVVCLLITTAIEAITHKKLNPKYEGYLHGIGMVVLLTLMGLIMFKDIFVLFKR